MHKWWVQLQPVKAADIGNSHTEIMMQEALE